MTQLYFLLGVEFAAFSAVLDAIRYIVPIKPSAEQAQRFTRVACASQIERCGDAQ